MKKFHSYCFFFFFLKNVILYFCISWIYKFNFKRPSQGYYNLILDLYINEYWFPMWWTWCSSCRFDVWCLNKDDGLFLSRWRFCPKDVLLSPTLHVTWPRVYQCNVPSHNLCKESHKPSWKWLEQRKSTQIQLDFPWDRTRVVRAKGQHSNHSATAAFSLLQKTGHKGILAGHWTKSGIVPPKSAQMDTLFILHLSSKCLKIQTSVFQ